MNDFLFPAGASAREGQSSADLTALRLLSPSEVAEVLAVSRDQVFTLMRSQQLPYIRIGKFYRIAESDLRQFLTDRRHQGVPGALRVRFRASPESVGRPIVEARPGVSNAPRRSR